MSVLGVRSVSLTTSTSRAWRSRIRLAERGLATWQIIENHGEEHILNLGRSSFHPDPEEYPYKVFWNLGNHIKPLLWPGITRELMGDLMPPRPTQYPADVWLKAPGAHGRGKYKKQVTHPLVLPSEWDWQEHINGQEYRLITVNGAVVQDFLRSGENGNRSYQWVAMRDVPMEVKDMARLAARRLEGRNVIAWDLIWTGEQAFLFEGNTCPGVNSETVNRIVDYMEETE